MILGNSVEEKSILGGVTVAYVLKPDAPGRDATDVGPGDYVSVSVGSRPGARAWKQITSNTAEGLARAPRSWTVQTIDGRWYDMRKIHRYARSDDLVHSD